MVDLNGESLGIQSYSQMMSKGCPITSETQGTWVPLPFHYHSQKVSQDPLGNDREGKHILVDS